MFIKESLRNLKNKMGITEVKKEGTGKRPSALSEWYRKKLGVDVAISDIDWLITSISNKEKSNRYLIIEEKNVSDFNRLLLGLGQGRSLKEIRQDIVKDNVPIIVIFVKDEDISQGVWTYEFNPAHIDDKRNWCKVGDNYCVDVKKYSELCSETDLITKLLNRVGSSLR